MGFPGLLLTQVWEGLNGHYFSAADYLGPSTIVAPTENAVLLSIMPFVAARMTNGGKLQNLTQICSSIIS